MHHFTRRSLSTLSAAKTMENLATLVSKTYKSAYENKHLLFTESTAKIVRKNNIQYSIRCAPALQYKPTKSEPKSDKLFNPFLPPDPNLKVLELDRHVVVLNKYCILPEHFLVVSKEFESQMDDLTELDISVAWECLTRMDCDERWLAFYNCGEFSGASQRHKHMQFIPLPSREEFMPFPDDLVERDVENDTTIPFQHYISRLSGQQTSASLYEVYTRLLGDMQKNNSKGKESYNFNMTREWMFLSPRKKDDYINQDYRIGINSTGMIGLFLTKSSEESKFLEDIGPATVLEDVGISWSTKRET